MNGDDRLRTLAGDACLKDHHLWADQAIRGNLGELHDVSGVTVDQAATYLIDHAARWGRWTAHHHQALHTLDIRNLTGVVTVLYRQVTRRHVITVDDDTVDRYQELVATLDPDLTAFTVDADSATLDYRNGRIEQLAEHGNVTHSHYQCVGAGLRITPDPQTTLRALQRAASLDSSGRNSWRLGVVVCDHPHGAQLTAVTPVAALQRALRQPTNTASTFAAEVAELDDSTFDVIAGLWETWAGTWGELADTARYITGAAA